MIDHEYVRFGSWPLQILTDATPLLTEAITKAADVTFHDVPTRVFRPEYLCGVALQTGRAKDYLRVSLFLEQDAVDMASLNDVVERCGLVDRLKKVLETF